MTITIFNVTKYLENMMPQIIARAHIIPHRRDQINDNSVNGFTKKFWHISYKDCNSYKMIRGKNLTRRFDIRPSCETTQTVLYQTFPL